MLVAGTSRSYTNSSKTAGRCHPSNIPGLLAELSAVRAESVFPALHLLPFLIPVSVFFKQAPHTALVLLIVLMFPGAAPQVQLFIPDTYKYHCCSTSHAVSYVTSEC